MSHDIFGERFYSLDEAAWHRLGVVGDEPLPALKVLEQMGEPVYTLEPIMAALPGGGGHINLEERAIVRHPTPDDDQFVPLGIAGPEYQLFTPGDCARIWDEAVARPVETLGFLARGGRFFLTSHIEDVSVRGDEVKLYQYALVELDGRRANEYGITGVRIVCANTLKFGQEAATERFRIVHDRHTRERMASWMTEMNDLAGQKVHMLTEAFDILAGHTVTDEEIYEVLDAAYPTGQEPRRDCPPAEYEKRMQRYEARAKQVGRYQAGAARLFAGEGKGMNEVATRGTAWGLYNAVVETEDYRRPSNRSTEESQAESRMFGERAQVKERAYVSAIEVATR